MIKIVKSNGEEVLVDVVDKVKNDECYRNDSDIQELSDEVIEDEYVRYISEYGLESPIIECMVENIFADK